MDAIAPSVDTIEALRAIASGGVRYQTTKEIAIAAGWRLNDNELKLGYVAFDVRPDCGKDMVSRLVVEVREGGRSPRAFVPLFYFEEYEAERKTFDQAFRLISDRLVDVLGSPSASGKYHYPHRNEWPYLYSWWAAAGATFILVQDEFDIQFGMDVTLWVLPASIAVALPVSGR